MEKCKNLNHQEKEICVFTELVNFLSKKWILLILKTISDWCKSFSEIEKNIIGSNPRILSNRLKELQENEYIEKKVISTSPLKTIYCLTEKWKSLCKHIDSIALWAKKNIKK